MAEEKKHNGETTFEYNKITDHIYIGTNMCCQTHFEKKLMDEGVTADVSLEGEQLDAPYGVESYLWLPVTDHEAPTQEQMQVGVEHIARLVAQNKKVYVHCKNGHGRGPTLVIAYLVSQGKSFEDAFAMVKEKRPSIHLEDVQVEAVKKFAENY